LTSKTQHISDEELNKVIPVLIEFEQTMATLVASGYRFQTINHWNKAYTISDKCLVLMRIKFTSMWKKGLRPDKDLQARFDAIKKEKDLK
jgi:hypothetical protein